MAFPESSYTLTTGQIIRVHGTGKGHVIVNENIVLLRCCRRVRGLPSRAVTYMLSTRFFLSLLTFLTFFPNVSKNKKRYKNSVGYKY